MNFRSEVSWSASLPIEAMLWISEIESAKSFADVKTSYSATGGAESSFKKQLHTEQNALSRDDKSHG